MSREESMRRHPSNWNRPDAADEQRRQQVIVDMLIADALDQQAMDLANRELTDAELVAGGPMRRLNERHHEVSGRLCWLDAATIVGLLLIVVFGPLLLSGWWPA